MWFIDLIYIYLSATKVMTDKAITTNTLDLYCFFGFDGENWPFNILSIHRYPVEKHIHGPDKQEIHHGYLWKQKSSSLPKNIKLNTQLKTKVWSLTSTVLNIAERDKSTNLFGCWKLITKKNIAVAALLRAFVAP